MGFALSDLILESIIRDGIENIKQDPTILDDVFAELTRSYASRKYGSAEIQKIKDYITGANKKEIAVVHSFHEAEAKSPCFSIQLGSDNENTRHDAIDDFLADERIAITEQAKLDALKKVLNFTPTAYDPITGKVSVDDSVDLSDVYVNYIYEDGVSTEHTILSGISNDTGNKYFFIAKNSDVDLNPGTIRSFLTEEQFELRVMVNESTLLIGCHSKEALLTKYLYILLKYFIESRKKDLIKRGFDNPVVKGSDFTRDLHYQGDMVFTRFLTVSGRTTDTWRSDQVDLIDSVEIDASVADC